MCESDETRRELAKLKNRLERERNTRVQAEQIAERSLRELYDNRMELIEQSKSVKLLQEIAVVANQASSIEEALQFTLDRVCAHTGWPVGHVYVTADDSREELVSAKIWHLNYPERFETFRRVSESAQFIPGVGLPGRVLAMGKPAWIVDVNKDPNFPRAKIAKDIGVKAGFGFPILVGKEVVGVLEFFAEHAAQPDEGLLEIMGHIGTQLGRVIERKRAEESIRKSEERYALAISATNDGLWDWDLKTSKMYFSSRWISMMGYKHQEIGDSTEEFFGRVHPEDLDRIKAEIKAYLEGSISLYQIEHRIKHRDGTYLWVLTRGIGVRGKDGKYNRMVGSESDITERKRLEEQLMHDAVHDSLTQLPNRTLFIDRVKNAVARAKRRKNYLFAVLFVDLDRFKIINDSMGHYVGDQLLISASRRLATCLRQDDTLARFGGDEFVILLDDVKSESDVSVIAERMKGELTSPFQLEGKEVVISASIGIALYSREIEQAEELLRNADVAMYRAKARGKAQHEIYNPHMHLEVVSRLETENDLRQALDREELFLEYQPIVSLESGRSMGFEALIRWCHPQKGTVPPMDFIPLAEETGLIVPIGKWVIRKACHQIGLWNKKFGMDPPLIMSVNLSLRQILQTDLVKQVHQILNETGVKPQILRLEITESIIMENPGVVLAALSQLKELGIQLHIDDFGTGYSSLSHLHRLPIDTLKIDRSFINRMETDEKGKEIVRTIVALAQNLGKEVTAEGVETAIQLGHLRALKCTYAQGYLFSKPLSDEAVERLLADQPQW